MNPLAMLQHAVALHNAGADCLVSSRRPMEAIRLIRRAMLIMKNVHGSRTNGTSRDLQDADESHPVLSDAMTLPTAATRATVASVDPQPPADTNCDPVLQNELYFIYRRPIRLPELRMETPLDDLDDLMQALILYSIFNLALACHWLGMVSATDAPLRQAMVLYQALACAIPVSGQANLNYATMDWSLVHCLVLNNLAYLHLDHCEYEESEYCAQRLYELVEATGCLVGDAGPFLTGHEVGEIQINSLFLQRPVVARAA